jgi:hypothetical protein
MVVEVRPIHLSNETKECNMWKTVALVVATAAIVGGAGTVALAASRTATPTPFASSRSAAAVSSASDNLASDSLAGTSTTKPHRGNGVDRLRRAVHAVWVTENKKTKTFTTHDAIRGQVTAVSPTSITVHAADGVTKTYLLSSGTRVHTRTNKKEGSISDVKTGDQVFVGGTGTTTLTAVRVIDATK